MYKKSHTIVLLIIMSVFLAGCRTMGNEGHISTSANKATEASWILEGQPLEFEGEQWHPQDGVETFLEAEVRTVAIYKGIPVFIDKIDVKPYERLYTKFDKYRYRFFEKQEK